MSKYFYSRNGTCYLSAYTLQAHSPQLWAHKPKGKSCTSIICQCKKRNVEANNCYCYELAVSVSLNIRTFFQ